MMPLFSRSFCAPAAREVSFTPLFRLLEDFDSYSREVQSAPASRRQAARRPRSQLAAVNPRFDIRETEGAYELHGELPGLERENVNIEFPEPQTIVIRGRVERSYGPESKNNDTNDSTANESDTASEKSRRSSHQATVEDEPEDENTPASTPATSPKTTEAVKPVAAADEQVGKPEAQDDAKYWLWERSVGEFSRAFTFPTHVDHDAVTASLSNGILSVTVPKAKKPVTRRVEINAL